jgi:hypothetical protein
MCFFGLSTAAQKTSQRLRRVCDVRFWHLADTPTGSTDVRFWHKADMLTTPSDVRF